MLTFNDVPWLRNILHVCERLCRADFRSGVAEKSVMRTVLLAHRIRRVRVREVHHGVS